MIPYLRDPDFIGRMAILERMDQIFLKYRSLALVGLGGVGYVLSPDALA